MNGYHAKNIELTKIKDLNVDREDFAQRSKKKRPLVASPKKKFNPLAKGVIYTIRKHNNHQN